MCNHLTIVFLLELVVVALGLGHVVGLGVDVGCLVGEVHHHLIFLGFLLYLLVLE